MSSHKEKSWRNFYITASACVCLCAAAFYTLSTRESATLFQRKPLEEELPHDCPGVESENAGKADACAGCPNRSACATGQASKKEDTSNITKSLRDIKHKILVLSGKGGVGKSTVSSQLAWSLHERGYSVGLLDIDICGPSIPMMTGTLNEEVRLSGGGWLPVQVSENFAVMSIGYLLPDADGAVIWRGPKKNGMIRQFLTDVHWGSLDFLIIDTPPGTSDEHLSVVTYLRDAGIDGAVVVTTPQKVSLQDVRKELNFCKTTSIPILGVVENMCESLFSSVNLEGTIDMCKDMNVPYAGRLTLSRHILQSAEQGQCLPRLDNQNLSNEDKQEIGKCRDQLDAIVNNTLGNML